MSSEYEDELQKIKDVAKTQVGINDIINLQNQYRDMMQRNNRVLGILRRKRILVASNSSY